MSFGDFADGLWRALASLFRPKIRVVKRHPPQGGYPSRLETPGLANSCGSTDDVAICMDDLVMTLHRKNLQVPHEVTVLIPRAEIRKRYINGQLAEATYTYSSITIAHSPRHPEERTQGVSTKV